jgi:hypothetical protein
MTDLSRGLGGGSLVSGALAGALSYVAGYLVVFVWQGPNVEKQLQDINLFVTFFGGQEISKTQAVGWLFYNSHFVRTKLASGTDSINFLAEIDGGELLYLLPVLLLVLAGLVVVLLSELSDALEGAVAGSLVTVGYFPLALIGAFVFRYDVGDSAIQPELVTAIGLAGLLYPLVLGAIGGALGATVSA